MKKGLLVCGAVIASLVMGLTGCSFNIDGEEAPWFYSLAKSETKLNGTAWVFWKAVSEDPSDSDDVGGGSSSGSESGSEAPGGDSEGEILTGRVPACVPYIYLNNDLSYASVGSLWVDLEYDSKGNFKRVHTYYDEQDNKGIANYGNVGKLTVASHDLRLDLVDLHYSIGNPKVEYGCGFVNNDSKSSIYYELDGKILNIEEQKNGKKTIYKWINIDKYDGYKGEKNGQETMIDTWKSTVNQALGIE